MSASPAAQPNILDRLKARTREVLKALGETAKKEEGDETKTIPVPPDAPSGMETDPRVGDASPTEGDLSEAAEGAAGADDGAAGADGAEGLPPEGAGDGDGDEAPGAPGGDKDGDEFDAHGNHDFSEEEKRAMQKAYGNETGQAEPKELLDGGVDVVELMHRLLEALEDMSVRVGASIDEIRADVNKLKAGGTVTDRKLSKALQEIERLGQPKPKAITKSYGGPGGAEIPAPPALPDSSDLYLQMKYGKTTPQEALRTVRMTKGQGLDA
jgi:hypothetical protein